MFSFKPFNKKEKEDNKKKQDDIRAATEAVQERLRHCLQSDSFLKYRKELENSEKALIKLGIGIMKDIKNPTDRVIAYDALFTRAEMLGLLLEGIIKDAKKEGVLNDQ